MSQSALLRHIFSIAGTLPASVAAVLIFAFIIAGCIFDLRFIIVVLMILLLALPLIAALLYFSHGLRPTVAFNVLPHSVRVSQQGAEITVFCPAPREEPETEDDDRPKEIEKRLFFPSDKLGTPVRTLQALFVPVNDDNPGFIYIPWSAIIAQHPSD